MNTCHLHSDTSQKSADSVFPEPRNIDSSTLSELRLLMYSWILPGINYYYISPLPRMFAEDPIMIGFASKGCSNDKTESV